MIQFLAGLCPLCPTWSSPAVPQTDVPGPGTSHPAQNNNNSSNNNNNNRGMYIMREHGSVKKQAMYHSAMLWLEP